MTDIWSEDAAALVFGGERRVRSRWRLAFLILLSLLAHAASFYVLQVAYTPTGSLLPPPARVVLVPLERPENAALAQWLALADPTVTIQVPPPAAGTVLDALGFRYVPSYDVMPPAYKPLDAVATAGVVAAPPRPMPPGPVVISNAADAAPEPYRVTAAEPGRVVFSSGIKELAPVPLPPMGLTEWVGNKPLEPTVFLIGVRTGGGVPFLFPVRQATISNANSNADEADAIVRDYLTRLVFRANSSVGDDVTWGRATVYWSLDPGRLGH